MKRTDMTAKQNLIETIENYMTEQQAAEIYKLINFFSGSSSKGDLMKLTDTNKNCDSAMPQNLVNEIQKLNPNFYTFMHVYDYRNKSFGELTNLAEELIKKYTEIMHQ